MSGTRDFLDTKCDFGMMTKEFVASCKDFSCSKDEDIHKFFHEEFEVLLLGRSQ